MLPDFTPSPVVDHILDTLLDLYERRYTARSDNAPAGRHQALRFDFHAASRASLSQPDRSGTPSDRQRTAARAEHLGWVKLDWLPGETGHLLATVTLKPDHTTEVFTWLKRTPQAAQRAQLIDLLLADRFRFDDWRLNALHHTIAQLKTDRSPAPFSLIDTEFNRDLLIALAALDDRA